MAEPRASEDLPASATSGRPRHIARLLLAVLAVAVAYGLSVQCKLHLVQQVLRDRPDHFGFHWTESAFHFRHFLMVADGRGIPDLDRDIQWPEGLDSRRYITPLMDRVYGAIYRVAFSSVRPRQFILWAGILVSSTGAIVVLLAARGLSGSGAFAFLLASLYAVTPASFYRSGLGAYIREDFALPFLFLGVFFCVRMLGRDRLLDAALAAAMFIIGLAAWHATQLFVSVLMSAFLVVLLVRSGDFPRRGFCLLVACLFAVSWLLPAARAKLFALSPGMMLGYGLLAGAWLPAARPAGWRARLVSLGLCLVFLGAALALRKGAEGYSHVYELLLAKARHLGAMPEDPAALSFEAKSMWTASFEGPTLLGAWAELSILGALALVCSVLAVGRLARGRLDGRAAFAVFLCVSFGVLYALMLRMVVFAAFFAALTIAALVRVRRDRWTRGLAAALAVAVVLLWRLQFIHTVSLALPEPADLRELLTFLRDRTAPDTGVLTSYPLGPTVCLYSGRPVALHPKWESQRIRDKVREFYCGLFKDEASFHALCRRDGLRLFVYEPHMALATGPSSLRHLVNAEPLPADCTAALFQHRPYSMRYFRMVFRNRSFRVFQMVEPEAAGQR